MANTEEQGKKKILVFFESISSKCKDALKSLKKLPKKQKILYSGTASGVVLLLITLVILWLIFGHKNAKKKQTLPIQTKIEIANQEKSNQEEDIPQELLASLPKPDSILASINNHELNSMIQKADVLYTNGDVTEALNVFEKIANFSQSLASYNLGVVRMRQKEYGLAIKSFDEAISTGEDVSLAALDAGVAARHLGNQKAYRYYLNLAAKELSKESKEKFYSYLYALIQFYQQNYFAALSALTHPNSPSFVSKSDDLLMRTFLTLDDSSNAIKVLEKSQDKDKKMLGLLYGRVGDYKKAREYLLSYTNKNHGDVGAQMALQIVFLKMHDFANAARMLDTINASDAAKKQAFEAYPIKITLAPKLFDVNLAQEIFVKKFLDPKDPASYKLLFYYAPFKVFNIKDALELTQEGGALSLQNIQASEEKMIQSQTIAQIDKSITESLSFVDKKHLRKAIGVLKKVLEKNPNHSILHYDAGLLYAQMEDYGRAYKHFIKAYYLDSKELDAGMFAILTSYFLNKDTSRIQNEITKNFENLAPKNPEQRKFLLAFLGYLNNNIGDEMAWVDDVKEKKSIYYALKAAYAIRQKDHKAIISAFGSLRDMYKNDFITNVFYAVAENFNTNFKEIALKLHNIFVDNRYNLDSVYYGPALAREFYAHIGFITGSLQSQENLLQQKLTSSLGNNNGILQALGLVNIYQHKFEQAYDTYNLLINQLGEDDARTQFLAAVAAVGMNDKDNASLLLQLSKMNADSEFETRFALGILYQQAGNFRAAIAHYNMIIGRSFDLGFFDFEIDVPKILALQKAAKKL
ncbi:tetratricopeptide repeat protein [Helicobacter mustelae]|uniref:Putative transmembrane protein Tetratricopeptide repeat-containing protein n=1 Tax=Helicobacter mustelae (strain ATCC 43772 / CCUG 25715 / CIP 103759 / LMG 18044 / NCTC 12198 / R85-136P) TaxID=679897 RepID=D3UGB4_HELM1|nr:tetratricopeptide repeat protein [Helicobacter mustelae]CBG39535.1 putative transmembrane protein; Tetratricopeptide repeat-containing protein [Helicobacter mustelae 12198]SQH71047.1 TPR repeat-containing protein [Helicobacter mustelae]